MLAMQAHFRPKYCNFPISNFTLHLQNPYPCPDLVCKIHTQFRLLDKNGSSILRPTPI